MTFEELLIGVWQRARVRERTIVRGAVVTGDMSSLPHFEATRDTRDVYYSTCDVCCTRTQEYMRVARARVPVLYSANKVN